MCNSAPDYMRLANQETLQMTFEEYLRELEPFGNTGSAEVRAYYERQYRQHLQYIDDGTYFEPIEHRSGDGLLAQYQRNLAGIFRLNDMQEHHFYFQVSPSFAPQELLSIGRETHCYRLTHIVLEKNYWSVFYKDNSITEVAQKQSQTAISNEFGDKLFTLLERTMIEARSPQSRRLVIDGVEYSLSRLESGIAKFVSKRSPEATSRSGKIITIMQRLMIERDDLTEQCVAEISTAIDELDNQSASTR